MCNKYDPQSSNDCCICLEEINPDGDHVLLLVIRAKINFTMNVS